MLSEGWVHVGSDSDDAASRVPDEPDLWTNGSLIQDKVLGAISSGSGFFAHLFGQRWVDRRWGHIDDGVCAGGANRSCRGCCSVRGPSQTVQRAEF